MRHSTYVRSMPWIAAACLLGCALVLWIGTGCGHSSSPKPRPISCLPECRDTTPAPLDAIEVLMWMDRARAYVQAQADRGEIVLRRSLESIANPRVTWFACPFSTRGYDTPGGKERTICAAGQTNAGDGYIRVSTWERDRTGKLVEWEARNFFWIMTGNKGLAY